MPAATARIGFDAIRALRNTTGLGNYARGVLRGLHEVAPALQPLLYSPAAPRPAFTGFPTEVAGSLHLPPASLQRPVLREYWRTFRLGRRAARDGVALYHGLTHEIPRDLPNRGIPSVVTIHDLLFHSHPELFPAIDRRSYAWRYRWSAERATAVVAVSGWTRQELHRIFGVPLTRIAVVPPPRDLRFTASYDEAARRRICAHYGLPERFLVSIGTLEPRKNHRVLLEAMAHLDPSSPPLVLIGRDGGTEPLLRAEIARLGLQQRVHLRPDVTDADLPLVLQSAAVAVYLSLAEGFGMPIVEAMSAGVPVIAASGPHLLEAGGDAACYVDPHDPSALAAMIEDLLHHRGMAAERVMAGRRYAETFDPAPLAKRLLAVYDAVLGGARLPDVPAAPAAFSAPEVPA